MIDDCTFRTWLADVPPIVRFILVAIADGEPVTVDEARIAAPYANDLADRLRRLPRR